MLWLVVDTDDFNKSHYDTYSLDSTNNWCIYHTYEKATKDAEKTLLNGQSESVIIIPLDTEHSTVATIIKSVKFD